MKLSGAGPGPRKAPFRCARARGAGCGETIRLGVPGMIRRIAGCKRAGASGEPVKTAFAELTMKKAAGGFFSTLLGGWKVHAPFGLHDSPQGHPGSSGAFRPFSCAFGGLAWGPGAGGGASPWGMDLAGHRPSFLEKPPPIQASGPRLFSVSPQLCRASSPGWLA